MWRFYHKNSLPGEESSGRSTSDSVEKPQRCSIPCAHTAPVKLWINHEWLGRWNCHPTGTFQPLERSQELSLPSSSALAGPVQGWIVGSSSGTAPSQGLCWFLLALIPLCSRGGHGGHNSSSKTGSGKRDSLAEPLRMLFICEILFSSSSKVLLLPGASPRVRAASCQSDPAEEARISQGDKLLSRGEAPQPRVLGLNK